jgi:hypothetical protein
MQWQKGFVEFLGFKVLVTYPPPEMVSAKKYEEILKNGTGAKLVIDNLQSGTEFGEKIAESFRKQYNTLKEQKVTPNRIFMELQTWAGGEQRGTPEHELAVWTVLAYYFERCDIFEEPRSKKL